MYIPPLITSLLTLSLPRRPTQVLPLDYPLADTHIRSFRPVQAHATHPESYQLLWHNASTKHNLVDPLSVEGGLSLLGPAGDAPLSIRTRKITIRRPTPSPRRTPGRIAYDTTSTRGWEDTEVEAPDVTDRETLRTLAKMTSNAYVLPESTEWWPLEDYNATTPFGWEKDADGLRGHVFADDTNSTVIVAIKGTSVGFLGYGGPTSKNDKFNDNLLFSCCCARVDFSWSTVCDCYAGGYKCEQTCVEKALVAESVYTAVGTNLYNNVTFMYPNANIWLVGHSLGGALSSLIGLSFGAPVVAFESPADRLAAERLHMPLPPAVPMDKMGITHVYHNADPIPMGVCTGVTSACYVAGIAIETRCHLGQSIIYDTVGKKGWAVDVRTHRIGEVINKILDEDWEDPPEEEEINTNRWKWFWPISRRKGPPKGGEPEPAPTPPPGKKNPNAVPKAEPEDACVDCFKWEFGDGWKKEPPTTTKADSVAAAARRTSPARFDHL